MSDIQSRSYFKSVYGKHNPLVMEAVIALAKTDLVGNLGVWLLSVVAMAMFAGIHTMQALTYFTSFPRDSTWLKILCVIVCIASLFQIIVIINGFWTSYVFHFGDWEFVVSQPWNITAEPLIAQINVTLAQIFFVYRVFILTNRTIPIVVLLSLLVLTSLVLYTLLTIQVVIDPYNLDPSVKFAASAGGISILADGLITGITSWRLWQSQKGVHKTTTIALKRLLVVTWEAALPPALLTVASIIVFSVSHEVNVTYGLLNMLIPRLYVTSLFFTLNVRKDVRDILDNTPATTGNSKGGTVTKKTPNDSGRPHLNSTIVFARGNQDLQDHGVSTIGNSMGVIEEGKGKPYDEEYPTIQVEQDAYAASIPSDYNDKGSIA